MSKEELIEIESFILAAAFALHSYQSDKSIHDITFFRTCSDYQKTFKKFLIEPVEATD